MRIAQVAPLVRASRRSVRRDGAGRLVPDRGAGRAGPRRHPVRQRRLRDARRAGACCAARAAPDPSSVDRSDRAPRRPCSSAVAAADGRVRHHPLPHRLLRTSRVAAPRRARTSRRSTAGSTSRPRAGLPPVPRRAARLDLRRRSARRCRRRTGRRPSTTACRWTSSTVHARAAASTSRSSGGCRRRSGPTGRSRSRGAAGMPLKIAAKVDTADREYFETEIEPLLAPTGVEFVGEIGDEREGRVPRPRPRAALPDRLARAVRPRDDRGDGLRHAGRRLAAAARCRR